MLFRSNHASGPVPTLLQISFSGVENSGDIGANNVQSYGNLNSGVPLIYFLNKGFGVAIINGGEVVRDENGFGGNSIQRLYYHGNQSLPRADEWGVLGGIAWQASRALSSGGSCWGSAPKMTIMASPSILLITPLCATTIPARRDRKSTRLNSSH